MEALKTKPCQSCGAEFNPTRPWSKFCSKGCRYQVHFGAKAFPVKPCQQCGVEFKPKRIWARFCSPTCRSKFWAWQSL
jgi:hypothetical protein